MGEQPAMDPTAPGFVPVCAIGASAGGVEALQTLFRLLPDDLGLAYVVVVHLAPDHPSSLHEILANVTRMPAHQVWDGPTLKPNCVFVIPPDRELVIEGNEVTARPFTDPRGRRAPIDMFFRSVAAARGDGIAVVLTGAGADGTIGARAIKEAGGIVMVQDPNEAGFPSMPQNAIASGVADVVAPIARLAERIVEAARSKEAVRSLDEDGVANDLRRIVAFLRTRTGHDFSGYKRSTVLRRVMRRMQVSQIGTLDDYARHLRSTPEEAKALFADLLISVTQFFRDPSTFRVLAHEVVAPLLARAATDEGDHEIRAWVAGCATGEEAYSLAILILEEADRLKVQVPAQIFATDLDEGALVTAREGRYPRSIEADVSTERLKRFFVDEGTHYRINRRVRDLVLFARHSVVREPPFMRLDLVTCRNLLIYLERALQQQVCAVFHYGLKPAGALFLGPAETADMVPEHFVPVDRDARIYRARRLDAAPVPILAVPPIMRLDRPQAIGEAQVLPGRFEAGEVLGESHAAALETGAPPSALVDGTGAVLHLTPTAGRFILLSAGPLSSRLTSIVQPELRLDVGMALDRAFSTGQPSLTRLITLKLEGAPRRVSVQVVPQAAEEGASARALVFFLDGGPSQASDAAPALPAPDELRQLHTELKAAQETVLAGRLGYEAALQELRASNEELQSLNEEYRSTAEELETSKEELQSINEELQTVNAELKSKLSTLSVAHDDLQNLTASSEIGTLFLDTDLRIRMFTPRVAELINITEADVGRTITNFTHRLRYDGIERDVRRVLRELVPFEQEIDGLDDRRFNLRVRPYRTHDNRIEGAVFTFDDITKRARAEAALRESEARLGAIFTSAPVAIAVMDAQGRMILANGAAKHLFPTRAMPSRDPERGARWRAFRPDGSLVAPQDYPGNRALSGHPTPLPGLEFLFADDDGRERWLVVASAPILGDGDAVTGVVSVIGDIDALKRGEAALRATEAALTASEGRLRTLVEGMPQLVWRADGIGAWTWASPQWTAYTGQTEAESLGAGWRAAVHPEDRHGAEAAWLAAANRDQLVIESRLRRASDGAYRWFQTRAVPVRDMGREVTEWLGTSTDIDDLRSLQQSQAVLVAELQHRTRNLIAVVRGIADDTMEHTGPEEGFRGAFSDRLTALSRVQSLLSRAEVEPITIAAVVHLELDALGASTSGERVSVAGPNVWLRNSTVQTLALALHELATNARKYGALSHDRGKLTVTWSERSEGDQRRLVLEWVETGLEHSPKEPQPFSEGSGYGRELIEVALPHSLGARTSYTLGETGVRCTIDLPVRQDVQRGGTS